MRISEAARAWREPDYPARVEAVAKTLAAENAFTEEALAFAINQQMNQLRPDRLQGGMPSAAARTVGVLNRGAAPLDDLSDLVAVLLAGHRYVGTVPAASPYLLPAFVDEVRRHDPALPVRFVDEAVLFDAVDALVARGVDEPEGVAERAGAAGIPAARRLVRGARYGVALIDGQEGSEELERLAEDALLHEGRSERNVAVVWAPRDLSPDAFLGALAAFRGVFPPHPATPGGLKMQQAFLKAAGRPHAHGEGLEFLVSRGPAEVQRPAHLRWVDFEDVGEAAAWLRENAADVEVVVARPHLARRIDVPLPVLAPGHTHRQAYAAARSDRELAAFLAGL